jgi:hypothetical protein
MDLTTEERNIRINKVLRELNISLVRAVNYFKDNGIIIESNPNYKLTDKEYKMLYDHFIVDNVRVIRINKVLRELNISLERAVDYLRDKGIIIESNPNSKISEAEFNILQNQFAGNKGNKEASKEVAEEKRKEKEALRLEREKEIENNQIKDKKHHELVSNIIDKTNAKFYLVDSNSENRNESSRKFNEGFWEIVNSDKEYFAITKKINIGDILISKSILTNNDEAHLKVKEIGIVTESLNRRNKFDVAWIIKNQNIDIKIADISNYRSIIVEPSKSVLKKIFAKIESKYVKILDDALSDLNSELQSNQFKPNITTIPGLLCDSEIGEDHLDINKDVVAFARVMAAKSFKPPLAIALLGKWGAGKSFFMNKLKESIEKLSEENPQDVFCEGIAHVHFNAWSYMDANLWASIVSRIFEGLQEYISGDTKAKDFKKEIEKKLTQNLNFSKDEILYLEKQNKIINTQLFGLYRQKINAKRVLKKKVSTIKQTTLEKILKTVNEKFKVQTSIEQSLNENPTFIKSTEELANIIPEKYWVSPDELCNQVQSKYTFLKVFFKRDKWLINTLWLIGILLIIYLTPIFTIIVSFWSSWHNFSFTAKTLSFLIVIGNFWKRAVDTYNKLQPLVASFWKIKENYETEKAEALFKFKQREKALNLEIKNSKEEINIIDQQISSVKEIKEKIKFKLENALSTEALYTFIEKRANSEDYKKHLGIVSIIRKDFEVLSDLLTDHNIEAIENKESIDFKAMFDKPLERIILYIDDLDRCPEERVVEVLEAVNLLMAFPLFVVVVGVDPRWVKTALTQKYKTQFSETTDSNEAVSPSNYLEKIFQVPFHLKNADDESIKNMIKTLTQAKPDIVSTVEEDVLVVEKDRKPENFDESIDLSFDSSLQLNNIYPKSKLFNKESIEALNISDKEIELLQDMSEIIGNNPRAVKRFVNIYRIIKTHEDFQYDKSTEEKEFLAIMFLLALSMGDYKHLVKSFEYHLNHDIMNQRPISDYFRTTNDDADYLIDEKAKILREKLKNLLSIKLIKLYKIETDLFAIHYPFIKRFTFKNI